MTTEASELFIHDQNCIQSGGVWVIGTDEVGRGPLAGPVHAAAVAIRKDWFDDVDGIPDVLQQATDSKQVSESLRHEIYETILEEDYLGGPFLFAVGQCSVSEIDELNILEASKLAMYRAILEISGRLSLAGVSIPRAEDLFESGGELSQQQMVKLLVDGRPLKHFPFKHEAIVKGDTKSLSIALASIAAKVERDQWMKDLHAVDPRFGWDKNKGYGTKVHREALKLHGATIHHRRTFLRKILDSETL